MQKYLSRIAAALFRPHKLFTQLEEPAASYREDDIHLLLVVSPFYLLGAWTVLVFARFYQEPSAWQAILLLLPAVPLIGLTLVAGRIWATYIAWAADHYGSVEISRRSAYQVFSYSLTPLLLVSLFSGMPFLMLNIFHFSPLPIFSLLAGVKLGQWVPLWILFLQWLGLKRYQGLGLKQLLIILLVPMLLFYAVEPISGLIGLVLKLMLMAK